MRVCIVSSDSPHGVGGLQWSLARIATLLIDAGHSVHLVRLASDRSDDGGVSDDAPICESVTLSCGARVFDITPRFSAPGTRFAHHEVSSAFARLDLQYEYDIVHGFGLSHAVYLAGLVVRERSKPLIVSARGTDLNMGRLRLTNECLWLLQNASWITFPSQTMRCQMRPIVDFPERSSVIYNSTDLRFFVASSGVQNDSDHSRLGKTIGGMGRLSYKKGVSILLHAYRQLRLQWPQLSLLWIGERDPTLEEQGQGANEISSLEKSGEVTITGSVPHADVLRRLMDLDVFVLCSIDEGCPNSLLEAMLARRPVVATRVGAIPEIVRDGVDGLLVHPYDPAGLAAAISTVLLEPERADRLADNAYKRVKALANPERERTMWLDCYGQVLGEHRERRGRATTDTANGWGP